jgi:glycosyltransferase involved in cell wall biosynthesis
VAKKGLRHQLRIYAAARAAGVAFEARIVGEGPLRSELEALARSLGLESTVSFLGHCDQARVWAEFAWADVLIHTGIVAPSGDRDGLPNVIPEAMTAGTLVITSPVAATGEAIREGETGLVADVDEPAVWIAALQRVTSDDELAGRLQRTARAWVEAEYNAHRNAERLHGLLAEAARP